MIEARTVFDGNLTNPLIKMQIRKLLMFIILISLFFCLAGVYFIYSRSLSFGIPFIVGGVLVTPILFLTIKFSQKSANKSMRLMNQSTISYYRFDENKVFIHTESGDDYRSMDEYSYSILYQAYETKDHFILYLSKLAANVIPKKDITMGSVEQLSALLSRKLGTKFLVIKMK